jgi:hypothetical protein
MKRVYLFQKDAAEARKRVKKLKNLGYQVRHESISPEALRKLKEKPPAAVLIDLSRAPSLGRDAGIYMRHYRATRNIPIVFFDGEPTKVVRIKRYLPDAIYTDWNRIKSALKHAIVHPPAAPVKPKSLLAGYSSTPLVKKLGIKAHSTIVLINAPHDFGKVLGKLPDGVLFGKKATRKNDMMIWFVKSRKELKKRITIIAALVTQGGLWIAWPKKGSPISSDLSQRYVRKIGIGADLVDYKVCAIDETWAGLKFARRK